jgi:hypothetical protein
MTATRRLTAILAADVAGYLRLMGADEEGTHERLCHGNANERTLRAKLGKRHAAATAPCHCVVASARKIRSVDREMR